MINENLLRDLIREVINAYKVLGVGPNPTDDEVKAAHRKLLLKLHPDLNRDRDTTREMSDVNVARDTFLDKTPHPRTGLTRKQQMDLELRNSPRAQSPASSPQSDAAAWQAREAEFWKKRDQERPTPNSVRDQQERDARRKAAQDQYDRQKQRTSERSTAQDQDLIDRKFMFVGGRSSKFWNVKLEPFTAPFGSVGPSVRYRVIVTFGRIGSQGMKNVKEFLMYNAARKFVQDKIFEKVNKGYQEVMKRPPENPSSKVGGNPSSAPQPQPKSTSSKESGSKDTYKVYGKRGDFTVHTGYKGTKYGNRGTSAFSPGQKVKITRDHDIRKIKVTDPENSESSQEWDWESGSSK